MALSRVANYDPAVVRAVCGGATVAKSRAAPAFRLQALHPALLLATGLALTAAPAAAGETPRSSSLTWFRQAGAETCAGPRELAQAVDRQLGGAVLVSAAQADVLIDGKIEPIRSGQGFRAHLTLTDPGGVVLGTRDLESPSRDCHALDEQLALVIALLIDPDAALGPTSTSPSAPSSSSPIAAPIAPPPSSPPPRLRPAPPVTPAIPPPPAPSPPWRQSIGLGAVVAAGLLPGVGAGLSLRAEVTPPWFVPIELGGVVWGSARAESAGRGADLSLSWGVLSLCPLTWEGALTRLRGCAGAAVGALRAQGFGFASSSTREDVVAELVLGARVTRRLVGPLQVGLGLALLAPLQRARVFSVDASGTEHDIFLAAAVAGMLDGEIGLAFP